MLITTSNTIYTATAAAAATALILVAAPSAVADPNASSQSSEQTITCENGVTYRTAAAGHGLFSPAHDLASTAILTPVSYGEITFTFIGTDGGVEAEIVPGDRKGPGALEAAGTVSCHYQSSFAVPEGTVFVSGEMVVVITPRSP